MYFKGLLQVIMDVMAMKDAGPYEHAGHSVNAKFFGLDHA